MKAHTYTEYRCEHCHKRSSSEAEIQEHEPACALRAAAKRWAKSDERTNGQKARAAARAIAELDEEDLFYLAEEIAKTAEPGLEIIRGILPARKTAESA